MKGALAFAAAVRKARAGEGSWRPVAVAGASELAPLLVRKLRAGGDAAAVRESSPRGAAVLVWIGREGGDALREASLARVPIVGVTDGGPLPYVLDTNLVTLHPGQGLPVERIARAVAAVVDEGWAELAARLPALRPALVAAAVRRQARVNALAAARSETIELPALALTHLRLGAAIGRAYGIPQLFAPAMAVGAGLGLLTRAVDGRVSRARWAARAAVAGAGTLVAGEAARRVADAVRSRS